MLAVGSNRYPLNNHHKGEQTLVGGMGKVEIFDVEEGEISDSGSIEEISEEDFRKQDTRVLKPPNANVNSNARVWTVRDVYKSYPASSGYASGLYNLAWAQAVQNKPLNDVLVKLNPDENSKPSVAAAAAVPPRKNDVDSIKDPPKIVIDDSGDEMEEAKMADADEREEGELEEGEIDMDDVSEEPQGAEQEGLSDNSRLGGGESGLDSEESEMEKEVSSIREALGTLTVVEAEKSFSDVCSRLWSILERMQKLDKGKNNPTKEALFGQSFSAVQRVNSVFSSMDRNRKERNKGILTRLLSRIMSQVPPIFIPEQMKEIKAMIHSADNISALQSNEASDKESVLQANGGTKLSGSNILMESKEQNMSSSRKFLLDSKPVKTSDKVVQNLLIEVPKPILSGLKGRAAYGPLLDLHKDHDVDSLPSPTREFRPSFPAQNTSTCGDTLVKSDVATPIVAYQVPSSTPAMECQVQNPTIHPYETDALAAVSTYQQKFGWKSTFLSTRLPSPTPSGGDDGETDNNEEVSSTISAVDFMKPFAPPVVSSAALMECSGAQRMSAAQNVGSVSFSPAPTTRTPAKSRDPRLRLANSGVNALDLNKHAIPVMNDGMKSEPVIGIESSRKHRNAEESVLDGPETKRTRITYEGTRPLPGTGGWLEDTVISSNRNQSMSIAGLNPMNSVNGVTACGVSSVKDTVVAGSDMLPEILKNVAVNPSLLMSLLKMGEQQRSSADAQQKSSQPAKTVPHPLGTNSIPEALPSVNVPSGILQKPLGKVEVSSPVAPTSSLDKMGKIRMKPRDPRRVLHNNAIQSSGSLGSEQLKANETSPLSTQENNCNDHANISSKPSQSAATPDIAWQFTKNLKNIANLMSASEAAITPLATQIPSPHPAEKSLDQLDAKSVKSDVGKDRTGIPLALAESVVGPVQQQNNWGDVEHLFEGYDDKQKAAIQKERTRRIDEQKKMFAARKLCLVLDLDHTLLNSAKFGEVDPLHEEILRKKEEQDREKPQRHLFRFSHMGMWTKLRPGIWNFLEKASKLYELHLYTMGNKLYATEMAKVLDPNGVLFNGRIIARGDDEDLFDGEERVPKTKDLEGVLGMESSIVIIDDSIRVWPHNKLNLIVVERYTYFPCSRRQFGLPGPSLLEIDHDERQEDGTLASSLGVIERLHQNFFSNRSLDDVDIRNILANEQRKILCGCRIVFSRVFPVGEAHPHLHPLWQTAEQFGAVCTNQIDEQVTHVVANSLGTDKVNWALSKGRFVVHPGWVEASALLYRRVNEQDFAIKI